MKNRKILVTGGAGFIGSTLVKRLAAIGADVSIIDNLWRGSVENLRNVDGTYAIDIVSKFHIVDLTDYSKCLELIRGFDLVYHLADVVGGIQFAFGNEAFIFRQNILINSNVLAACTINHIPNYVYVGTACSYPKSLQMKADIAAFREEQAYPAEPESSYGWSKLMGEYEAELAQKTGRINLGLLRFHNVYGPGASFEASRSQVLPSLILKAINYPGQPFVVWGNGNQYRDFIYIDDIVEALILIVQHGLNRGPIQIGSEKPTSIREAAETIVKISGKPIEIIYDTGKPEGDHGRIAVCDRAREILGWRPKVDLETGLRNSYDWIYKQVMPS
jgi:GDP-D-mannose 3',5'-epimerase